MKAIVLAAGRGTRLGKYANGLPKCMLEFAGKPLLERQLNVLRESGINDITVVTGFASDKIAYPGVNYRHNPLFASTNMVETLLCARDVLAEGSLVCYGDVVYEPRVLQSMLDSSADVSVAVDCDYLDYWQARLGDAWVDDTESMRLDGDRIVELGRPKPPAVDAQCRYVGLLRFTQNGARQLLETYDFEKKRAGQSGGKWRNSPSFQQGFMTDLLMAMVDRGVRVTAVKIKRGWLEFDTAGDYELANSWLSDGSIARFIDVAAATI